MSTIRSCFTTILFLPYTYYTFSNSIWSFMSKVELHFQMISRYRLHIVWLELLTLGVYDWWLWQSQQHPTRLPLPSASIPATAPGVLS